MQNLEIERKYLIVLPDEEFLKSRDGCIVRHITQTYLLRHENDVERRIRKIEDGKNTFYVYTEKRPKSSTTRLEDERDITAVSYTHLSDVADSPEVIAKYGDMFEPKRENWEDIKGRCV